MATSPAGFLFTDFMAEKKCRVEDEDMDLMDSNHGLFLSQDLFSPLTYETPMSAINHAQLPDGSPSLLNLQRLHPRGAGMKVTSLAEENELDSTWLDDPDNLDAPFGGVGRQVTEYEWPDQTWPESWGPQPPELFKNSNSGRSAVAKTMGLPGQMTQGNLITLHLANLTANLQAQQDERKPFQNIEITKGKLQNDQQLSSGQGEVQMPCMGDPELAAAAIEAAQRPSGSSQRCDAGSVPPAQWQNTTTVMLRNIPNKYNRALLLDELDNAGFAQTYDFLYLPIDPETSANRGYAFINLCEPNVAWLVRLMYEGQKMGKFNSDKVVSVVPAALQGFEANYAHYSSARVNRGPAETRPLFLRQPSCMPSPTTQRRRGGRRSQGSLIDQATRGQPSLQKDANNTTGQSADKPLYYFGVQGSGPTSPGEVLPKTTTNDNAEQAVQQTKPQTISTSVRFCQDCGGKARMEFKFCQFCGAKLQFNPS